MKYLSPKDPGLFVIRRLSKVEYGNTLHDLFGVDPQIAHDLPDEVLGAGYTNSLSPLLMEQYLVIANEVLDQILCRRAPPTAVQQRSSATPPAAESRSQSGRAEGRPVARPACLSSAADRRQRWMYWCGSSRLATDQGKLLPGGAAPDAQGDPGLAAVSLHHTRPTASRRGRAGDIVPLDDYQLASRFRISCGRRCPMRSCRRWPMRASCMTRRCLPAQARRLLEDPRSRALFDGFGAQWLGLDKLAGKTFDAAKFPQMTSEMRRRCTMKPGCSSRASCMKTAA